MNLLSLLSFSALGFNWVDIFVLVVLVIYGIEGYGLGFLAAFLDLLSFVASFILGLSFYFVVGKFIVDLFHIPQAFGNAIGFFAVAALTEVILFMFLKLLVLNVLKNLNPTPGIFNSINKFLGIIPGILSGLLLTSFILTLIIALPFSNFLKHSVSESKVGNILVANTQGMAKDLNNIFGGALNETLSFLTVEPKSDSSVNLNFSTTNISVDNASEKKMFEMVNQERTSRGLSALETSTALTDVGRAHCEDMFKRGYFSHYTPEGLSPFDRMSQADITFNYAGENLALAPNVDLAMKGLMQSPGHRANILSKDFHKLGVGVIDGGAYGEMFCQEFTD